jgi:hypothetical protein
MSASIVPGPYGNAQPSGSNLYVIPGAGRYNRSIFASASQYIDSGSIAVMTGATPAAVNLVNGGSLTLSGSNTIYEVGISSIVSGSVTVLYAK